MNKFKAIEDLILDLNFEEAFKILKSIVPSEDEEIRNSVILIEIRYNILKRDHDIRNLIPRSEAGVERNNIIHSIMQIKNTIAKVYEKLSSNFEEQQYEGDILKNKNEIQSNSKENAEREISEQIQKGMKEINSIMSKFIPDFKEKFSNNVEDRTVAEIRRENTFKLKTARAFVFGRTRTGKTTTINYLLDSKVFPSSGQLTCTKSLACGEHKGGLIFYDSPGIGDAYLEENLTRVALGLSQEKESKYGVKKIRLIDITSKSDEGANEFVEITDFQYFKEDIEEQFYLENKDRIKVKEFEIKKFQEWFKGQIDFFILMVNSKIGLDDRQIEFLEEVIENNPNKPIFKLFNLDDSETYTSNIIDLQRDTANLLKSIQEKLKIKKIEGHDKWFIVNARKGLGFKELIQEFADTLPINVLNQLEKQVRKEFLPILNQRLQDIFLDYVKNVAAILSVYPVDYSIKNKNLLSYAFQSLFVMADYVFSNSSHKLNAKHLEDLIEKLKSSKFKVRYERRTVTEQELRYKNEKESRLKPGFWRGVRASISVNLTDEYDYESVTVQKAYYQDVNKTVSENTGDYYYAIGGIDVIEKILAVGAAIAEIYLSDANEKYSKADFQNLISENHLLLSYRYQIIDKTKRAGKATEHQKHEIAREIYELINKDLPPQYKSL